MTKKNLPLPPSLPTLIPGDFYLEEEKIFEGALLEDADCSYDTCKNLLLKQCQLKKITLQKTRLEQWECQHVVFEQCDFSNLECYGASFHRVVFKQCKLTGTNFADSYFRDCTFIDCTANFSSFSNTNIRTMLIDHCQCNDSEFTEVDWKHLTLKENQLNNSNWFHTKLASLDFRSNRFEKIALSMAQLKGLVVDQEQALIIAAGLGLVID